MKLVKIERDGSSAQGIVQGEDVRIVGGWRPGPAESAPFSLGGLALADLQAALAQSS